MPPHTMPLFKEQSSALATDINARNRLDGRQLIDQLADNSIAVAFFDPQYRGILDKLRYGNEGVQRGQRRVGLPQMDQTDIAAFLLGIYRVLRPSGHLFLWVDKFHLCEGVGPWFQNMGWLLVDMIVWDKTRIGMGYRTRRRAEYLIVAQKPPKRARGVWVDHTIPDVWAEHVTQKDHTHAKPLGLQKRLIEATTDKRDYVLDPAAGSYSVLQACTETERNFIGCDIYT
ncbi:MAG: site-specific DNA-methyltransferase [Clostridiales bacterium]|jgi:site-specific DNA-methyltransferase (adenine-specific)|nr:site-specific DNA-methyltransferase [Clostridiales bacterium]